MSNLTKEQKEELMNFYCNKEMKNLKNTSEKIFKKYGINNLDYDEYYSIANETLWKTIETYDGEKCDNFHAFFVDCLKRKFFTYFRDQNSRKKRNPDATLQENELEIKRKYGNTFVSLDAVTPDGVNLSEVISSDYNLENEVIDGIEEYSDKLRKYFLKLSKKQIKVAKLLIDGYSASEIISILKISNKEYMDCMSAIKKHSNIKILFTY